MAGLVGSGRTEMAQVVYGAVFKDVARLINGKKVEIKSPDQAINHGIGLIPEVGNCMADP